MDNRAENISILEDADQWVQFPFLPLVKRGEGWPEVGFLIVDRGYTIYKKNMWDFEEGPIGPQLEGVPTETFASAEALLDAGWEVD